MIKDGTMDVEMNQAVSGIKGTTLVCEETGKTSTLKVIDGEVKFTAKANGKAVNVGAGKMVTATTSGLGSVSSFNIDKEKAKWSSAVVSQTSTSSSSTSTPQKKIKIGPLSCFIATAAYGSETAAELDTLRAFRDKVLLKSKAGKLFVDTYYYLSPPLAEYIAEHEEVRTFVREALLDPVVTVLNGTQEIWDSS